MHSDELMYYNNSMAKVIQALYGWERFKCGGGITCTEIYAICKAEQYKQLSIRASNQTDELRKTSVLMLTILEECVQIKKPRFV